MGGPMEMERVQRQTRSTSTTKVEGIYLTSIEDLGLWTVIAEKDAA
jgi:hypothetical protein